MSLETQGNQVSSSRSSRPPPDLLQPDREPHPAHANAAKPLSAAEQAVDTLWNKIEEHRRATASTTTYFAADVVPPNFTGVQCPDNAQTLKVQMGRDKNMRTPLHANHVQLGKCYAVGQSPEGRFEDTCMRDLVHSLDSGQGLFQFTSRNAHHVDIGTKNNGALPTIAHMLGKEWEKFGEGMQLGDRYVIQNFRVLPNNPPQPNVTRYAITAFDIKNGLPDTKNPKTVHITQAGLRFVNKLLQPEEIVQAAKLFASHPPSVMPETNEAEDHTRSQRQPQTGPLICSAAGIGRSAVLAVYQDLCSRMPGEVNQDTLDHELAKAIEAGIDARGAKFLHSKAQLAVLRQTLLATINKPLRSAPADRASQQILRRQVSSPRSNHTFDGDRGAGVAIPKQQSDLLSCSTLHVSNSAAANAATAVTTSTESPRLQNSNKPALPPRPPALPPRPPLQPEPFQLAASISGITDLNVDVIVVKEGSDLFKHFAAVEQTLSARTLPPFVGATWHDWNSLAPYRLQGDYRHSLDGANLRGLRSIAFASQLIARETTSAPTSAQRKSVPVMRAAALAVSTVTRVLANPTTTLKNATFHCATASQKKCYDDLLNQREKLKHHRVYEALMRPPIRIPASMNAATFSTATTPDKFLQAGEVATYVPPEINGYIGNCDEVISPLNVPHGTLNGVPFTPWTDVPSTVQGWNVAGGGDAPGFDEPAPKGILRGAGVVVVEKEGRVWVVAPTRQFGNLTNTFPKGEIGNAGLTARGCAVKEAYEKSGLQIRLTRHLIDSKTTSTRYYLAERIGGTPADVGWESQAVSLVLQSELDNVFDDADGVYWHYLDRSVQTALRELASQSAQRSGLSTLRFARGSSAKTQHFWALSHLYAERGVFKN